MLVRFFCIIGVATSAASTPTGETVEFASGARMPSVSLGTYSFGSKFDPGVVAPWFAAGGAAIDTMPRDYHHQPAISTQLEGKRPFLTTKIVTMNAAEPLTAKYALKWIHGYVQNFGVKPLDLVLLQGMASDDEIAAMWQGMEEAVDAGLVGSIGLEGFNQAQTEALLKVAKIRPVLNQCAAPSWGQTTSCGPRDDAIAFFQSQNIMYQAWEPLQHCPLTDPGIVQIAEAHNVSASQVCLRWVLERGCTMVVGTGSIATAEDHSKEYLDIFRFKLAAEEVAHIDTLGSRRI